MPFVKIIFFHFTAYPFHSLAFILAVLAIFLFLKKSSSDQYIKKTFGAFILLHIAIFWGKSFSSSIGTGAFINPNTIITNEHVVNKTCSEVVVIDGDKKYSGKYIDGIKTKGIDLAFVRVAGVEKKIFAAVSSKKAKINQQIFFTDYDPNNLGNLDKSTGFVENYLETGEFNFTSKNARPGNSGSVILNEIGGIVGVLWGGGTINHFFHSKGNGGDGISNSIDSIINLAKKNNLNLYQAPDKKYFQGSLDDFISEISVSIICKRP